MTPEQQAYFDFIVEEHCPYHTDQRRKLAAEGAKALYDADVAIYEKEVQLIESMGENHSFKTPAPPKKKDDFVKTFRLDRVNNVMTIYSQATATYRNNKQG